jgi:hypothetical protein
VTGKILEMNDQQAVIQLDSQRLRRDGHDETSAPESRTLTLKRGERTTLETLTFPAAGTCEPVTSYFAALFATRKELSDTTTADYARASTKPLNGAATAGVTKRGEPARSDLEREVDLWLIHTSPGRPDETLHLTSKALPFPTPFSFPAAIIRGPNGTVSVKVDGTIETGLLPDGQRRLHFTTTRAVTTLTSSRPVAESKPVIEGSTKTTVALPGPDEVLSFEMPPLRASDGVTLPDRLSIRLRLTPK